MTASALTLSFVERARAFVAGQARRTACGRAAWLGGEAWLKREDLQETGSFKVRGALARVGALTEEEARRGVHAASAGNHGAGLAWAARRRGVSCVVCVPRTIPAKKEANIRALGAEVVKTPFDGYDETQAHAIELARATGRTWVSPFDDDWVIAGNGGTTALEILEDAPDLDAIVVPCGGGGLAIGAGVALKARSPRARLIGVNTEASPGMALSRRDGRAHLSMPWKPTLAEGLEGGVSEKSYALGLRFIDDVVVVREETIRRAMVEVARHEGAVVEGSAAAAVAAALEGLLPAGLRRVAFVLSGSNVDGARAREILSEAGVPQ